MKQLVEEMLNRRVQLNVGSIEAAGVGLWHSMQMTEVPKFLVNNPSGTTHAIHLVDPLDAAQPLFIPFYLQGVTIHFTVHSLSIEENENKETLKIYFTK